MNVSSSLFVPAESYIGRDFAKREAERLWPFIWQMVCREEQIAKPGNYHVYEVVDQSFLIVRTNDHTIRAYYNSCLHRGRRLLSGSGVVSRIRCPYHAWTYDLEGRLKSMLCPEDYAQNGIGECSDARLQEVKVDTWGGFVFINCDLQAEPLLEFLDPLPKIIGPFDWGSMRYAWYTSIKLKCNWKTAIEAFLESYHPPSTHSQINSVVDTRQAVSFVNGKHGHTGYPNGRSFGWSTIEPESGPPGSESGSPGAESGPPSDFRPGYIKAMEILNEQSANVCRRDADACRRLLSEVPATATFAEVAGKAMQFMKEAAEAAGAKWPEMTDQQVRDMGNHWNICPNVSFVPGGRGASLVFRALPDGDNPDSCFFDFGALERFASGAEPPFVPARYDNWSEHLDTIPRVLAQDFAMVEEVQRGMHGRSWSGARLNTVKEKQIFHNHEVIDSYLNAPRFRSSNYGQAPRERSAQGG